MRADCHIHMVLDGVWYKDAIAAHSENPREDIIRRNLSHYRDLGFTWLREGGDRWNVGQTARRLAPEYGITYRSPVFPIYQKGHYGGFIGRGFETWQEYLKLIHEVRKKNGNYIKVMISGLMDFNRFGVLTEPTMDCTTIRQMVHIAHEEGFSVMAHANGADTVLAAVDEGVDSVEHGAYLNTEALAAMKENGTVWVPTLSTIGALRGKGRFCEDAVEAILNSAMENVNRFVSMGGLLAPGSDAGAYGVLHGEGGLMEYDLMSCAGADEDVLERGIQRIKEKF